MPNNASMLPRRSLAVPFLLALVALLLSIRADAQTLRMFSPNGGENWVVDSTYTIRWLAQGSITGPLYVEYTADSGSVWKLIDTVPARTGVDSLSWKVPNDTSRLAFVRVRTADSSIRGVSRRSFRITLIPVAPPASMRVLSPNGGEAYALDSTIRILWSAQNTSGPVTVSLSIDSGRTWTPIGVGSATALDSLVWKVSGDTTRKAMIRVRSDADSTLSDRSDRTFQIRATTPKPRIVLTAPNGGETFMVDSTTMIRWEGIDIGSGLLRVEYSDSAGKTWMTVANRLARSGPDSVAWKLPSTPTTQALVRLIVGSTTVGDTSDAVFTIKKNEVVVTPKLTLIYPTNGGSFMVDSAVTIRWTSEGITKNIVVEYSTDSLSWKTIASVPGHTGPDSVRWVVPDEPTVNGRIRVGVADSSLRDVSSLPFMIVEPDTVAGVASRLAEAGTAVALYPNPTAGAVELRWHQPAAADVRIVVVGTDGRLVRAVALGRQEPGMRGARLDMSDLPAGIYRVEIGAGADRTSVAVSVVR